MSNPNSLFRALLLFTICIFLAVFLGYTVASPLNSMALMTFGVVFLALAFPLLLRSHFFLLVLSWNINAVLFFLPGSPPFWMLMVGISLAFSITLFALDKREKFLAVPSIIRPLIFIAAVGLMTAEPARRYSTWIHGRRDGGRETLCLCLSGCVRSLRCMYAIPLRRAYSFGAAFFLGSGSAVIGNLLPLVNPAFFFIFYIFPPERSGLEALGLVQESTVTRFGGISLACIAIFTTLLARYGIRGILDLSGPYSIIPMHFRGGWSVPKPWRFFLFLTAFAISLVGGFRSTILLFFLTFAVQFYFEGLFRSRLFPILALGLLLGTTVILPMADRLPLAMQRALSFLPVNIDPIARVDAQASTEWRLAIWRRVLPDVPQYLMLGKGYAINAGDLSFMTGGGIHSESTELTILAGDYHNGPLTLLIPLGIWGMVGFLWFVWASMRFLYKNYKYSPPELLNLNRFLLVYFIARFISFMAIFGSFYTDFFVFAGIVGLSTSINHGVRKAPSKEIASAQLETAAT